MQVGGRRRAGVASEAVILAAYEKDRNETVVNDQRSSSEQDLDTCHGNGDHRIAVGDESQGTFRLDVVARPDLYSF